MTSTCGSLRVVGTGIRAGSHVSRETTHDIMRAERLVYLVADVLTESWLRELNPGAESLDRFYAVGKDRRDTYEEIADYVVSLVRREFAVCFALYGHPGVFATAAHAAVRRARAEGFAASMLPAISAQDCLFADLGIDPGRSGCRIFDATDFLLYPRPPDTATALILFQIGAIGERSAKNEPGIWNPDGLALLSTVLTEWYGAEHPVTVYEAARYDVCKPVIQRVPVGELTAASVTRFSTLYVPRLASSRRDPEVAARLNLW